MAKFWAHVDKAAPDGHWLWTGPAHSGRYGHLGPRQSPVASGTRQAHRIAWELEHGPIGDDLVIDHVCRVKLCVRPHPDHLEPVTQAENVRRGLSGVLRPPPSDPLPAVVGRTGQQAVNREALKARRWELYSSRRAFCEAAGISLSYSKYIEAGTHQPSRRIARDIARALQWDVEQLYQPLECDGADGAAA